jgi:hypothetical protein
MTAVGRALLLSTCPTFSVYPSAGITSSNTLLLEKPNQSAIFHPFQEQMHVYWLRVQGMSSDVNKAHVMTVMPAQDTLHVSFAGALVRVLLLISGKAFMEQPPRKRTKMAAAGSAAAAAAAEAADTSNPPVSVLSYRWTDKNVFHAINEGRFPAEKIFDRPHYYALLDKMPVTHGHALLITKHPVATLLDNKMPPKAVADTMVDLQVRRVTQRSSSYRAAAAAVAAVMALPRQRARCTCTSRGRVGSMEAFGQLLSATAEQHLKLQHLQSRRCRLGAPPSCSCCCSGMGFVHEQQASY